jgi:hypothetical protein
MLKAEVDSNIKAFNGIFIDREKKILKLKI